MSAEDQTSATPPKFDFAAFPADTLFHDRRDGVDRRTPEPPVEAAAAAPKPERRARKERRRRIDPTTFEKQYTHDELEFMTAMQRFKVQSGRSFPSHGDVLRVAAALGYRKAATAPAAAVSSAPRDAAPAEPEESDTPTIQFALSPAGTEELTAS
ncbi:MAG TPA: hypothetical protein VG406_06200 [Isosphaeraceae bacterium]|jgi:hypothetical protein|nr:hypothetical protein [Isosphaeraceae bacterium]